MKRCNHTHWLSTCTQGGEAALLESDRLQALTRQIPSPDDQYPSMLVLIGSSEKSIALRALFGLKRNRKFTFASQASEIHLHLDPSSVFNGRPMLVAEGNALKQVAQSTAEHSRCHETLRHPLRRALPGDRAPDDIYTHLLFPFTDVFCFFSTDIGGLRQVARHLAAWIERGHSSSLPRSTLPAVIVVIDKVAPKPKTEMQTRAMLLRMLGEETAEPFARHVSSIEVVALFPHAAVSGTARYRRLKERLMERSDEVRKARIDCRMLFSATHFAAFLRAARAHFADSVHRPFDFLKAARSHNPVATDLVEHHFNFLKQVSSSDELTNFAAPMLASSLLLDSYPPGSHLFDPRDVFSRLYRDSLCEVGKVEGVPQQADFVDVVESRFIDYFDQFRAHEEKTATDMHRMNLLVHQSSLLEKQSTSTCLCCMRRRPQFRLDCDHSICENCAVLFGRQGEDDPWVFTLCSCIVCGASLPEDVPVRVHPPTAGAGVLCIDGGGARGIVPLMLMKRIQEHIGLPIPFQRYIKVAFGVSIGAVIAIDHFVKGRSLTETIQMFPGMAERAFKRRKGFNIPLISRAFELVGGYLADGLYSSANIESALQEVFGDKSIMDSSYATQTGTKIGVPVATVSNHPSYRIFTNYNGVGVRDEDQDEAIIKPKDGCAKVPLWEIARSASAAPMFYPPKYIEGVGTFQDAGALENDPLLWALSEASAMFPLAEEPDFVISLGTGEPGPNNYQTSTSDCRKLRGNGMILRTRDLIMERMRDKAVRRAYKIVKTASKVLHRIHRLNVDFDAEEPRLDDTESIPKLKQAVETDPALAPKIDVIARCMVSSLFYFELDTLPERANGKWLVTGHILCTIRRSDVAFGPLMSKLHQSARFFINDWPVPGAVIDPSFYDEQGNFQKRIELETFERFSVSLKEASSDACNISGSPFTLDKLIAAQHLDAPFGTADHGKRKRCADGNVSMKKRRLD